MAVFTGTRQQVIYLLVVLCTHLPKGAFCIDLSHNIRDEIEKVFLQLSGQPRLSELQIGVYALHQR